jgi:hypothetical protein
MGAITAEVVDTGEKRDARGRRVTPMERRSQMVQAYRSERSDDGRIRAARADQVRDVRGLGPEGRTDRGREAPDPICRDSDAVPGAERGTGRTPEVCFPDGTVLRGARVAEVVALVRALRT